MSVSSRHQQVAHKGECKQGRKMLLGNALLRSIFLFDKNGLF